MEASCICDDVECPPDGDLCTQDICGVLSGKAVCYPPYSPEDDAALYCPYYDGDLDGVPAENDNCPNDSNGKQRDWDANGTGDACATNACINTSDLEVLDSAAWKSTAGDAATCEKTCSEESGCTVAECMGDKNSVSPDCARCIAASENCIAIGINPPVDTGHFQTVLSCTNRRHIPCRPGANYDDIIFTSHI